MKTIVKLFQHISFVVAGLLILQILNFSSFDFNSAKGIKTYKIDINEVTSKFVETDNFNEMLGISISDIIDYSYLSGRVDYMPNDDISENYKKQIIEYSNLYDNSKTNINYVINYEADGVQNDFLNVNKDFKTFKNIKDNFVNDYGIYLIYDAQSDYFVTNSKITENTFKLIINNSGLEDVNELSCAFGLNKDLNNINDSYREAILKYTIFVNLFWIKIAILVVSVFIYIFSLVYLCFIEGNKSSDNKLSSTDYISFEIRFILLSLFMGVCGSLIDYGQDIIKIINQVYVDNIYILIVITSVILLGISIVINFFLLGLIRRISHKLIYNTSILKKIINLIDKLFTNVVSNYNSILKAIIIIGPILLLNSILLVINKELIFFVSIIDLVYLYFVIRQIKEKDKIYGSLNNTSKGLTNQKLNIDEFHGENVKWAQAVNEIENTINKAVDQSMKDEKMKTDLITNVSHDLKTPLTSIISYVDLLKKENIQDERVLSYINVLDEKSQRLKMLTDDLVEASKITSGNYVLNMEKLNINEFIKQIIGEFSDKFNENNLAVNITFPEEDAYINADSNGLFRIVENLFNNICKYALQGTRVYIDLNKDNNNSNIIIKNISSNPLTMSPKDLTERFIRGDESRTTEGSGLGLSIAKSLTEAMGGTFNLDFDGDLFKVYLSFKNINE